MPKRKTVFIFAYYSMKDPVFQSAVLPYFRNFPNSDLFRFVLLTFEQKIYDCSAEEKKSIKQELLNENIIWFNTRWHSGRFKIVKKAFDFLWGIIYSCFLIFRYRAKAVYSEGFPGAVIGHYISKLTFSKHMVHTFEPHADYYIENGSWKENSWEARLLKYFEKKIAARCTYIFTATQGMIERIKAWGVNTACYRVPSCVDLNLFKFDEIRRNEIRSEINIAEDEIVLTYLGKFGGYYWDEELFRFFAAFENLANGKFRYCIFTTEDQEKLKLEFEKVNISPQKYIIKKLSRAEVSDYLSASDYGISAVRAFPSKRFCSPIKNGEYWACGLPVIAPANVSDDFLFIEQYNLGEVLNDTSDESFKKVAESIANNDNVAEERMNFRKRALEFVKADRDVSKYKLLYAELFGKL